MNSVASAYLTKVTNLTVTGTIDARDFKIMRDSMPVLAVLDLSSATITAYTGTAVTDVPNDTFAANTIPQFAFCNQQSWTGKTTLTSITFPSSVTSIGDYAFSYCSGFTDSLTIPSSVTKIGTLAFFECSFTSIIALNPVPLTGNAMGSDVFEYDSKVSNFIVPCGSVNVYKSAPQWNSYGTQYIYFGTQRIKILLSFNFIANDKFVLISVSKDNVISGTSVTFTADTSCLSASVSLQWQVNGKNEGTGKGIFIYIPLNGDTVTCQATINDTTTTSNAIVMKVMALSVSKDTLKIGAISNSTRTFSIFSNEAWTLTTSKTQTWLTPNITSGSDTALITLTATANTSINKRIYTITISGNNVNSQTVIVTQAAGSGTGILDITGSVVKLYPNPNEGNFTVEFSNPDNQNIKITITDMTGKTVFETSTTQNTFNYNGNQLQPGVYIVSVNGEDSFHIGKMVVK